MHDDDLKSRLEGLFSDAEVPELEPAPEEAWIKEFRRRRSEGKPPESETAAPEGASRTEQPPKTEVRTGQEGALLAEDLQTWQRQLIRGILRTLVIVGALAVLGTAYDAYLVQQIWRIPLFLVAYALLVVITFWPRTPYTVQAGTLLTLLYGLGIFELFIAGQTGDAFPFMLIGSFVAALFLGRRAGIVFLGLAVLTLSVFGWTFVTGRMVIPVESQLVAADLSSWVSRIIVFVMLASLLVLAQNYLIPRFADALAQSRRLTQALEEQSRTLEQRVADRTRELDQHTALLQAAANVSRAASSLLEPGALIRQTVTLIRDRFDYYYVGLFLLDASGRWAELRAGTGEAGREMLIQRHKLKVGSDSMIGWCTAHSQARIALDVGEEAVRFANPLLPETRSEMALPLIFRGRVIGAITVQSAEPQAFSDKDAIVLQTMTDQVANAIENARLLREAERLARRSQLTSEISARLRGALDLEEVLQTTVRELGMALGASEAVVRLSSAMPPTRVGDDDSAGPEEVLS